MAQPIDPQAKRPRISIDIEPGLRRQLRLAAAKRDITVGQYVLEAIDARLSRVVECRFFAGLTEAETAEALGVNARTVTRDWVKARAWLYRELSDV